MAHAIETLRASVQLAARQGVAQARITLQPETLGAIRIHLTHTDAGLLARVTAETAAGAQALASSQADLHGALASLGAGLLRLDIGASGQSGVSPGSERSPRRSRGAAAGGRVTAAGATGEIAAGRPTATIRSPAGTQIDVLA